MTDKNCIICKGKGWYSEWGKHAQENGVVVETYAGGRCRCNPAKPPFIFSIPTIEEEQ